MADQYQIEVRLDTGGAEVILNDMAKAITGADQAQGKLNKTMGDVKNIAMAQLYLEATRALKDFASGIGQVAGAYGKFISVQAQEMRELQKMSLAMNRSIDDIEALDAVARKAGMSGFNDMASAAQRMSSRLVDSKGALTDSGIALTKLGVTFRDSNGEMRDSLTVYEETMDKLMGMKNASEASALAMQIGGRAMPGQLRGLKGLGNSLSELKTQMDAFSVSTQSQQIALANFSKQSAILTKTFSEMNERTAGAMAQSLLPLFEKFNAKLLDISKNAPDLAAALGLGSVFIQQLPTLLQLASQIIIIQKGGGLGQALNPMATLAGAGAVKGITNKQITGALAGEAGLDILSTAGGIGAAGFFGKKSKDIDDIIRKTLDSRINLLQKELNKISPDKFSGDIIAFVEAFDKNEKNFNSLAKQLNKVGRRAQLHELMPSFSTAYENLASMFGKGIKEVNPAIAATAAGKMVKKFGDSDLVGSAAGAGAGSALTKQRFGGAVVLPAIAAAAIGAAIGNSIQKLLGGMKGLVTGQGFGAGWNKNETTLGVYNDWRTTSTKAKAGFTDPIMAQIEKNKQATLIGPGGKETIVKSQEELDKALQAQADKLGEGMNWWNKLWSQTERLDQAMGLMVLKIEKWSPETSEKFKARSKIAADKMGSADLQKNFMNDMNKQIDEELNKGDWSQESINKIKGDTGQGISAYDQNNLTYQAKMNDAIKQEKLTLEDILRRNREIDEGKQKGEKATQDQIDKQKLVIKGIEDQIIAQQKANEEAEKAVKIKGLQREIGSIDAQLQKEKLIDENKLSESGKNKLLSQTPNSVSKLEINKADKQMQLDILQGVPESTAKQNRDNTVLKSLLDQFRKDVENQKRLIQETMNNVDAKIRIAQTVGNEGLQQQLEAEKDTLQQGLIKQQEIIASLGNPEDMLKLDTMKTEEKLRKIEVALNRVARVYDRMAETAKQSAATWSSWAGTLSAQRQMANIRTGNTNQTQGMEDVWSAQEGARREQRNAAQIEKNKAFEQIRIRRQAGGDNAQLNQEEINANNKFKEQMNAIDASRLNDQMSNIQEMERIQQEKQQIDLGLLESSINLNATLAQIDRSNAEYLLGKNNFDEGSKAMEKYFLASRTAIASQKEAAQRKYMMALTNLDARDDATAWNTLNTELAQADETLTSINREAEKFADDTAIRRIDTMLELENARKENMDLTNKGYLEQKKQEEEIIKLMKQKAEELKKQGKLAQAINMENEILKRAKGGLTLGQELLMAGGSKTNVEDFLKSKFGAVETTIQQGQMDPQAIAKMMAGSTVNGLMSIIDMTKMEAIGNGNIASLKEGLYNTILEVMKQVLTNGK